MKLLLIQHVYPKKKDQQTTKFLFGKKMIITYWIPVKSCILLMFNTLQDSTLDQNI
jgi:hypothetical protein